MNQLAKQEGRAVWSCGSLGQEMGAPRAEGNFLRVDIQSSWKQEFLVQPSYPMFRAAESSFFSSN